MATYKKEVTVTNPLGIHARPSSLIVKEAERLQIKEVFITRKDKPEQKVNPGSIMGVMMLSAHLNTELVIFTEREDMHEKIDELAKLIGSNFEKCY
jgi:phosphocarrier protein